MSSSATTRGYAKLAAAAAAFHFDFRGKVVLDIGSSTGGFTAYALERGARQVIAVEKGTNQMRAPLRFDPRVILHEKTDIFTVVASNATASNTTAPLVRIPSPDVILADVSFISLTKVLEYATMYLARSDTDYLVMLKPQFEAAPDQLRSGVIKNSAIRRAILERFETWLKAHGFVVLAKRDNKLAGRTGNIERFYHLRRAKTSRQAPPKIPKNRNH